MHGLDRKTRVVLLELHTHHQFMISTPVTRTTFKWISWWRHQMETFPRNQPIMRIKRPVKRRFDVYDVWCSICAWTNGWVTIVTPLIWDAVALIMTSLSCMHWVDEIMHDISHFEAVNMWIVSSNFHVSCIVMKYSVRNIKTNWQERKWIRCRTSKTQCNYVTWNQSSTKVI